MRVIAIDPGVTIGLAHITEGSGKYWSWDTHQTKDIIEAFEWVDELINGFSTLVIEDFISAGHLTKEAKRTLKVIGFFEYSYQDTLHVEIATPQKRLPFVKQAHELTLSRNLPGPHSADALAHALAKLRRMGVQGPIFK